MRPGPGPRSGHRSGHPAGGGRRSGAARGGPSSRGGPPGIRGPCWSARSWPSRPSWPGWSPPTAGSWTGSRPRRLRRGPAGRGAPGLAGPGLQPPGPQPAPGAARPWWPSTGAGCPPTSSALLPLPGVGAYTARAVLAFAFEADVGVVDTNAGRVLSRAVAGRPVGSGRGPAAGGRHGAGRPGAGSSARPSSTWGPTVCVAGTPRCSRCPVRRRCRWAAAGRQPVPTRPRGSAGVSVAQSRLRRLRPAGPGPAGRRPAPGAGPGRAWWHRSPAGPTTPTGPPDGGAGWWRRGWWSGPRRDPAPAVTADRATVAGLRFGRSRALRPVTNRMMWSLTSSGRSTWRKCPAPSTTTISEPGARNSVTGPMVSMPMQPSSAPWRYSVGWGAMVPRGRLGGGRLGVVGRAGEHGPVVPDGGAQALG